MARSKINKKNKVQEQNTFKKQTLAYQGSIQVKIMHGNKVISTKKYLNKGLPPLFKYISHALAGSFYSDLRPCKIKLYKCPYTAEGEENSNPAEFNWYELNASLKEASPYIVYDATPVVKEDLDKYSTTFKFKIPFWWLYSKSFNVIGLYTNADEACAYYLFTDETDPTQWDTQELEDTTGNFSLIIEWTMEVSNKEITNN